MIDFISKLIELNGGGGTDIDPAVLKPDDVPTIQIQDPCTIRAWEIEQIRNCGIFEASFYLEAYGDIINGVIDPLEHFYDIGWREDRRPNFYFEPKWYLDQNPDVAAAGHNPLFHYVMYGDWEGRDPGPLFRSQWYRETFKPDNNEITLAHYLRRRKSATVSPFPDFDIEYYAKHNQDVVAAGVDPFEHFVSHGYTEWRNPSPNFDIYFYVKRYLKDKPRQNPFFHWLENRHRPGVHGRMPDDEASIPREIKKFTKPSRQFEEYMPVPATAPRRAKLLAYYLPQFHAFPENDEWWGKGFTEWTNIPRGVPRFCGHYQPRVPRDLGYYELNGSEMMRRQIAMAKGNGIFGFVFYHYWFNGKRLMDKPVEALLEDPSLNMPFALMWANENWTRRWDGSESNILISQDYHPQDNALLAADFARHFKDPRYIRIQGRPLLMIYRPGVIPNCAGTIATWRDEFQRQHNENPLIFMVQAFGDTDRRGFGCDGAVEFPPHKLTQSMRPANQDFDLLDMEFVGKIYHYDAVVRQSLDEPAPPYPLIKTAFPSWDNDARRQGNGLVIAGSTPEKYQAWLSELVERAEQAPCLGDAMVCVNAWNEWCEGTYLEPDLHFGAAYLNATGRAVCGITLPSPAAPKLLLIGHDAFPSGAQHLLLNIGRTLTRMFGIKIEFLLLDGGRMKIEYDAAGPTFICTSPAALTSQLRAYVDKGFTHAIVNTSAAARIIPALVDAGIASVLLIHELPRLIREKNLAQAARVGLQSAAATIFPAAYVRDSVLASLDLAPNGREIIQPQGSYKIIARNPQAGLAFRSQLDIAPEDPIVLGVGYADLRKGFDLFLQLWRQLHHNAGRPIHLCWLGDIDPGLAEWLSGELAIAKRSGTFHMPGYAADVIPALSAATVFALTSREDPFPTVVLEAVAAGLPVVAFAQSGGMPEVIEGYQLGRVVAHGDSIEMAQAITALIDSAAAKSLAEARRDIITEAFSFPRYVERLMNIALPGPPRISVVVPNYNYARYMPERLGSIFRQTHPVSEIIVLDDKSSDESLEIIPAIAKDWNRQVRLLPNEVNSGSVFAQWRKAAETATGTWLWIAEADDAAHPRFLESVMAAMGGDESIVLAFSDSRTINVDGTPQWPSYKGYYSTVEACGLEQTEIFEAATFVRRFLSVKNLILNVSAVVWNRKALLHAFEQCEASVKSYKMAGDWRLYLEILSLPGAKLAYQAAPLNVHRRHLSSVTHALAADEHLAEIERCHEFVAAMFDDDAGLAARQQDYLGEVAAGLGLTKWKARKRLREPAIVLDNRPARKTKGSQRHHMTSSKHS